MAECAAIICIGKIKVIYNITIKVSVTKKYKEPKTYTIL